MNIDGQSIGNGKKIEKSLTEYIDHLFPYKDPVVRFIVINSFHPVCCNNFQINIAIIIQPTPACKYYFPRLPFSKKFALIPKAAIVFPFIIVSGSLIIDWYKFVDFSRPRKFS